MSAAELAKSLRGVHVPEHLISVIGAEVETYAEVARTGYAMDPSGAAHRAVARAYGLSVIDCDQLVKVSKVIAHAMRTGSQHQQVREVAA